MRLIDADVLCKDLLERWSVAETRKEEMIKAVMADTVTPIIVLQPTIEPEQKRSKWTYNIDDIFPMDSQMECDNCHASYPIYLCNEFKFCPNCGAKMER